MLRLGGLAMLMQMVSSPQGVCSSQPQLRQPRSRSPAGSRALKESPSSSIELQISRVRRDAANAIVVLMEDDACKQEVRAWHTSRRLSATGLTEVTSCS